MEIKKDNLLSLLDQHDDLYDKLLERKNQLEHGIFPLDDMLYSIMYDKFVTIYNLLILYR